MSSSLGLGTGFYLNSYIMPGEISLEDVFYNKAQPWTREPPIPAGVGKTLKGQGPNPHVDADVLEYLRPALPRNRALLSPHNYPDLLIHLRDQTQAVLKDLKQSGTEKLAEALQNYFQRELEFNLLFRNRRTELIYC